VGLDKPPQSVSEALDYGWTGLSFECRRCKHQGRIDLAKFDGGTWRGVPLASLFARCVCSECGTRPITAKLAQLVKDDCWFEKRVDFVGLEVIRPTRE
jgi:hypothetical protein